MEYFTSWLFPGKINGLGDHFEFNLLPRIRGLYAKEKLAFTDIPYSEPEIEAIFLSHARADYFPWKREFMEKNVTYDIVHKNQSKLIMDLDFYQFAELVDIRPERGSCFIHGMSEPFSEEDIQDEVLHNWLTHFGIQFHQLHASGHLDKEQIGSLISEVQPKKVYPVHTENARLFKEISDRIQLIDCGKEYKMVPG